jgi:hypothetical protein
MRLPTLAAACAALWMGVSFAAAVPASPPPTLLSRRDVLSQAHELGKKLSKNAAIVLPSNSTWDDIVSRGSYPRVSPGYGFAVEVAVESDVQVTVMAYFFSLLDTDFAGPICAPKIHPFLGRFRHPWVDTVA